MALLDRAVDIQLARSAGAYDPATFDAEDVAGTNQLAHSGLTVTIPETFTYPVYRWQRSAVRVYYDRDREYIPVRNPINRVVNKGEITDIGLCMYGGVYHLDGLVIASDRPEITSLQAFSPMMQIRYKSNIIPPPTGDNSRYFNGPGSIVEESAPAADARPSISSVQRNQSTGRGTDTVVVRNALELWKAARVVDSPEYMRPSSAGGDYFTEAAYQVMSRIDPTYGWRSRQPLPGGPGIDITASGTWLRGSRLAWDFFGTYECTLLRDMVWSNDSIYDLRFGPWSQLRPTFYRDLGARHYNQLRPNDRALRQQQISWMNAAVSNPSITDPPWYEMILGQQLTGIPAPISETFRAPFLTDNNDMTVEFGNGASLLHQRFDNQPGLLVQNVDLSGILIPGDKIKIWAKIKDESNIETESTTPYPDDIYPEDIDRVTWPHGIRPGPVKTKRVLRSATYLVRRDERITVHAILTDRGSEWDIIGTRDLNRYWMELDCQRLE